MKKTITLFVALFILFSASNLHAQISFTILNKPVSYVLNLDSLARIGASNALPYGWYLYQSNGTITYRANAGDSANGNIYSYGAATGFNSRTRALGSISSKSDSCYFGAMFVNQTGYAINDLTIAYTVEQWRLGATGRGPDTTEFDFSTNATTLTGNGTWVNYPALNMTSPVTKGTVGPLNGALPANETQLSYKITGLNIPNNAIFWIRWYDHIIKGANDGLGIQNLTINAYSNLAGPTVVTQINAGKFPQTAGIPDTTVYGKFHGLVLSPNFVSGGKLQFSIRDSIATTGFRPGIGAITCISATDLHGYKPNIGDSVYVTGKIRSANYLTYLQMDTLVIIKANKNPKPVAIVSTGINDYNESNLIKINNLSLAPTATWDTTGAAAIGGFTTTARTAAGATITIYINKNSNIFLRRKPNFPFNLTGIALQYSTNPNTGYFIWPRFAADFDTLPQPALPLKKIADITDYFTNAIIPQFFGRADSVNKSYALKGVVHSPNLFAGGMYFNLIDNTGAITVYNIASVNGYIPKIGDSVMVRGTILQQNGLIVIAADSIRMLPKGTTLTPPKTTTTVITKDMESYLLTLNNVRIINPKNWDSTTLNAYQMFEVKIANNTDTFFMDIAKTTDLFKKAALVGNFKVTGVVGENNPATAKTPYDGHYTIIPRGSFDIVQTKIPAYKIGQIKPYNATTGVADSIGVGCYTKGVVQSGILTDTGTVAFAIADNTGAITVANVYNINYKPVIGDSILLLGTVSQTAGLTIFEPDSLKLLNSGNKTLSPVVLTALDEKDESALITVQGCTMVDPNQWDNLLPANKYGFNVQFIKGKDTIIVHISDNAPDLYNLPYAQKPTGKVDITGIELQKTKLATAPFANYYLEPRMISDFSANSSIAGTEGTDNIVTVYPNPVHNSLEINSYARIEKLVLTDMTGKILINLEEAGSTQMKLDLSSLKAGIYMLQVYDRQGINTTKIIRE